MSEAEDLPKANVKRIVGAKLTEFQEQFAAEDKKGRAVQINKDALEAFVQSAKIFIHYLSATANEICQESRRSTVNAEDVIKALEEMEFDDLIEPLKEALGVLRIEAQAQKGKRKAAPKKRKAAEEPAEGVAVGDQEGEAEGVRAEEGGDEEMQDNQTDPQ